MSALTRLAQQHAIPAGTFVHTYRYFRVLAIPAYEGYREGGVRQQLVVRETDEALAELLTTAEAARLLGKAHRTVRGYITPGQLPIVRRVNGRRNLDHAAYCQRHISVAKGVAYADRPSPTSKRAGQ